MCAEPPAQPQVSEPIVTGGTITVVLRGEFDVTSEGFLRCRMSRIGEMRPSRLVFEMAEVSYLDCASARLIARTSEWLPAGVKPVVRCPSSVARRVLQVSGIGAFCELED